MKVSIAYCYPASNTKVYAPLARRFVETCMENPPGMRDHDIYVLVNGGINGTDYQSLFNPLPCSFLMHDNSGKDIGAYQMAAEKIDCDLLVCLGAPLHFHRAGWLDRIVNAYEQNGPGMYGAWGLREPTTHLRTTAFFVPPELLKSYPKKVGNGDRYQFESGRHDSMTAHTLNMGLGCYMVTWSGCYEPSEWHPVSEQESIIWDQHVEKARPCGS